MSEPVAVQSNLALLQSLLLSGRFDCQDETRCQDQVAILLECHGVPFEREYRLSSQDIIDFYLPRSGLGIEVKVFKRWSKRAVYRQVERYCGHDQVKGLLLATAKAQGLPIAIAGKPVRVHQLGLSAL